ncbi:MAG: ImmA/IrrE family metallo-endopeptidase [Fimbriimonadales bacterium]
MEEPFLTPSQTSSNPREVGRNLANDALHRAFGMHKLPCPIPFEPIAKALNVSIERDPSQVARGLLWESEQLLLDNVVSENDQLYRGWRATTRHFDRFSLAHELGHAALLRSSMVRIAPEPSPKDLRTICNSFAANLLVPDGVLGQLGEGKVIELTSSWINQFAARCRVSFRCFLGRLADAETHGVVSLCNGAVVVIEGRGAKSRGELAPRLATVCLPKPWFIPSQRRISSVGMKSISERFHTMPALVPVAVKESIQVFDTRSRKTREYLSACECVAQGEPHTLHRLILVTFSVPT